jgi:hypothetical protein
MPRKSPEIVCGLTAVRALGCFKFYASSGSTMLGYWVCNPNRRAGAASDVIVAGRRVGKAKSTIEARQLLRPDWTSST